MFKIRQAGKGDFSKILSLYQEVSKEKIGIARTHEEITEGYIECFMKNAAESGIELVIENPNNTEQIIAEIHCYKLGPKVFDHVLSELTVLVDKNFQGQGVGKLLFTGLLDIISTTRTDILRVELIAQESNVKAIEFYKKIGFAIEGRFEKRIITGLNTFEADIPMAWINKNYLGAS